MPKIVSECATVHRELWTADEFLDWLEPGRHADSIDGEKFMHSPVNIHHARLLNFLDRLLADFVETRHLGEVFREVVAVRLGSRNVFLPDLAFVASEQIDLLLLSRLVSFNPRISPLRRSWLSRCCLRARQMGRGAEVRGLRGARRQRVLGARPETLAHRFLSTRGGRRVGGRICRG
ncbi:MAG: Uma2 family endonuclease [Verrucomicrobia bacterium]|nr:Uma2 family endonuclease [Verrucomicrobiota bacterium]